MFYIDLRTISDFISVQPELFGFYINKTECVYCVLRTELLSVNQDRFVLQGCVLWLTRLAAGVPLRRHGFDPRAVCVRCVVDGVSMGQVSF